MLDGFLLKKLSSVFVHVIPGIPILVLVLLLSRRLWPRFSYAFSILLVSVLIALSSPLVSNYFVSKLESHYPVLSNAPNDTKLILVLGWGHNEAPNRPPNSILAAGALSRLTEGVRLWQTQPDAVLAVSGAGLYGDISHAQAMKHMALVSGVPEASIITFDTSRDTAEEIESAVSYIKNNSTRDRQRLVIVSSATHLPRAALMIDDKGIAYSMAPTDFLVGNSPWYRAGSDSVYYFDRALHEWVGMLWHRLSRSVLAQSE